METKYPIIRLALIAAIALVLLLPASGVAASGELDTTFGTDGRVIYSPTSGYDSIRRMRIQPDGKILSFGGGTTYGLSSFMLRHLPDGRFDPSFGSGGVVTISGTEGRYFNDMAILASGNILLTGNVSSIFAYIATGFSTFDSFGNQLVSSRSSSWDDAPGEKLLIQDDGKVVVVVCTGQPNFAASNLAAIRYSEDAESFDMSFGPGSLADSKVPVYNEIEFWNNYGAPFIGDAIIQPDGRVIMMGSGTSGSNLVRLTSNGAMDSSFGTAGFVRLPASVGYSHPAGIMLQPDGKIVINGVVAEFGLHSSYIIRLNPNGTMDTGFGTNGLVTIPESDPDSRGIGAALALQSNGRIITAGERDGGFALMRFNSNGTLDTSFGTNGTLIAPMGSSTRAAILSLAWQADRTLVAAGSVGDPADPTDIGLARFRVDDSGVSVTGRVLTSNGTPLRNASVNLIDSQGSSRTATTGSFGLFTFDNVAAGTALTVSVSSKRYRFATRAIQPTGDLALDDFVGLE